MRTILQRKSKSEFQVFGELKIFDVFEDKYACKTLELPWKNNQPFISCIPAGTYTAKKRYSNKHKQHFIIEDVPGRTYILIHAGNFYTDITGCILVGNSYSDINADGVLDILNSKKTLAELYNILPEEFELTIMEI